MRLRLKDEERKKWDLYAWPGGYQVTFLARDGFREDDGRLELNPYDREEYVVCGKCAHDIEGFPDLIITDHFVHWEGPPLYCEYCNEPIESEYGFCECDMCS